MNYSFGPQRHPDFDEYITPVGWPCSWCAEPIQLEDNGFLVRSMGAPDALKLDGDGEYVVQHRECHLRSVIGSVAHVQKRCSCYNPGAKETDPPELTKREAARLAVELWEKAVELWEKLS
jgi:hypothetical protein